MKTIRWNKDEGRYELADFASLEQAKAYIDSIALTHVVINNDEDYKAVKESRTLVNAEHNEVSTVRKQMTAVILSTFEPTLKELEHYIQEKSDELTKMLYAYKPPKPRAKKSWKLEATFDNEKAFEKVKKIALKYNAIIKEEGD